MCGKYLALSVRFSPSPFGSAQVVLKMSENSPQVLVLEGGHEGRGSPEGAERKGQPGQGAWPALGSMFRKGIICRGDVSNTILVGLGSGDVFCDVLLVCLYGAAFWCGTL